MYEILLSLSQIKSPQISSNITFGRQFTSKQTGTVCLSTFPQAARTIEIHSSLLVKFKKLKSFAT